MQAKQQRQPPAIALPPENARKMPSVASNINDVLQKKKNDILKFWQTY